MSKGRLILYSRKGCCLCEGLEERLRSLSLHDLSPKIELLVLDIDSADVSKQVREHYNLQVPVMLVEINDLTENFELPRVSPRLNGDGLFQWLQKTLTKISESA